MTISSLHHSFSSKIHWKISANPYWAPTLLVECSHPYPPLPWFQMEMPELYWRATRLIPTILLSMSVFFITDILDCPSHYMLESSFSSSHRCSCLHSKGESIFLRRCRGSMGYWPTTARLCQCHRSSSRRARSVSRFIGHTFRNLSIWCWCCRVLLSYTHLTSNDVLFENHQSWPSSQKGRYISRWKESCQQKVEAMDCSPHCISPALLPRFIIREHHMFVSWAPPWTSQTSRFRRF